MVQQLLCLMECYRVMQAMEEVLLAEKHLCFVSLAVVFGELMGEMDVSCWGMIAKAVSEGMLQQVRFPQEAMVT